MNPTLVSVIAFLCVSGGIVLGLFLHTALPPHHFKDDSRSAVQLGMGVIGTMTAILLGVLIGSGKGFYDSENKELTEVSAKILLLDRALALYGPETHDIRSQLRDAVQTFVDATWPQKSGTASAASETPGRYGGLFEKITSLQPQNEIQRTLQSHATTITLQLATTRFLMAEQKKNTVPLVLIIAVIFWLTLTFCSFGLLAPRTGLVVVTFLLCALSVSAALFLLLEMYNPYTGVLRLSSEPLRLVLAHLGQ